LKRAARQFLDHGRDPAAAGSELVAAATPFRRREILGPMAEIREVGEPHHSAGALERMQLAAQRSRRLFIRIESRRQLGHPIDAVVGFLEEEREQVVVVDGCSVAQI
jgi:hypothetical protein